jgi:tetrahydromethanopterin S-methyltransferase subunit H
MLKFKAKQKVFEIGKVKLGGRPGENPCVLYGCIFYEGEPIVKDHKKGIFDKEEAEELLKRQEELSDQTGNPCGLDVVITYEEAIEPFVGFLANISEAPLNVGSMFPNVRISIMKYISEVGLKHRVTCGPISLETKAEEYKTAKEVGIDFMEINLFNKHDPTPEGRIKAWRKLSKKIEDLNLKGFILDTAVLDFPSLAHSVMAIYKIKDRFGLPTGCAPENGIDLWRKIMEKKNSIEFMIAEAVAYSTPIFYGANFLVYMIEYATFIFPACSIADALVAYGNKRLGINPIKDHPLYKIFK